ncbi:MFS transporter [Actinomadura atramentaria]|uniref:MFS transporter n=1 Tax=Actinomadura atramentaria TaxID=1990 RepID=UPI00035C36D6|nr:MFS transporter [Actinomadura atramentaria]
MTDAAAGGPPGSAGLPETLYRWRWVALMVILAGEIMDMLDALITTIASPSIRSDLGGTAATIQWLAAGYTLAMAVGLITGGRLGDLYGRKRMFVIGAAGFTVGSLLCGVAASPGMLVGARVLQGLFGSVMLPQGIGMIRRMFDEKEMGTAFGLFGPIMGLSSIGGPVLAGWLVDADLFGTGWRMIFLINLPLGIAAVVAGLIFLPGGRSTEATRLDLLGAVLAGGGAALLVYPLVQGRELGWPAWTFAMIAAAVAVFGAFGWYQARRQRTGRDPLITPSLFRKRGFVGGLVVGIVFFSAMTGFALTISLYIQMGLGYSPLKAGLSQIPWSLGMIVGFGLAQAVQRFGRHVLQAGTVIMAGGVVGVVVTLKTAGIGVTPWQLSPALVVTGLGMGLLMAPFFGIVMASVDQHETGSAGGTMTAVQQLGSSLGAAVLGTIFFGLLATGVATAAAHDSGSVKARLAAVSVGSADAGRVSDALRACGRDRASTEDAAAVPASCVRLEQATRAAAGTSTDPAAVSRIVGEAGKHSAARGFSDAMITTLWVVVGMLGLTLVTTFLLPMHARPEDAEEDAAPAAVPASA